MIGDTKPLQIFATHLRLARRGEGPRDIRVFANQRLLYASYQDGREQLLDVSAHDRLSLLVIYLDWVSSRRVTRRAPTPDTPARESGGSSRPAPHPAPARPIV